MSISQITLLIVFFLFLVCIAGYFFVKGKSIERSRAIALIIAFLVILFGIIRTLMGESLLG